MGRMKRKYEKPMLLKEEFTLESTIAACAVSNPLPSQIEQCAYDPEGLGYTIFAEKWASCTYGGEHSASCYYDSANNLFSS